MKKKATTKKIVIKNKAFIAAIQESNNNRVAIHNTIVSNATKVGIVKVLQSRSTNKLATAK